MSTIDDLLKAFDAFNTGVQSYAITRGINQATQQVDALRNAEMDEMSRRRQQDLIARNLAAQLVAAGANQQQIQTAVNALSPEQIRNSADAYSIAARTGDQSVRQYADQLYEFEQRPSVEQRAFQASERSKDRALQRDLLQMQIDAGKFDRNKGGKPLSSTEVDKIQMLDDSISGAEGLLNRFMNDPSVKGAVTAKNRFPGVKWVRELTDENFASFKAQVGQDFDAYRKAITGAGASAEELRMLMANRPSMDDTPEAFAKKFETIIKILYSRKAKYLQNLEKAGRDVSNFEEDLNVAKERSVFDFEDGGIQNLMKGASTIPARPSYVPSNYVFKVSLDGRRFWVDPNDNTKGFPID